MNILGYIFATILSFVALGGVVSDMRNVARIQDDISVHTRAIESVQNDIDALRGDLKLKKLGAAVTTIQGTDTIKDSRTTINTNFSNLNADVLGTLTPARITATSTTASSTIAFGLEVYARPIAVGASATTTIRGDSATSSFKGGISTTGTVDVQSTTATSTYGNGVRIGKGCYELPSGSCLQALDLSANNIWTGTQTTFNNGVIMGYSTTTNATTTNLAVTGTASTSVLIVNSLGVGVATSTQNSLQVQGAAQITGALSIAGNATIATTTGTATGFVNPIIRTNTGAGPTSAAGQATLLVSCNSGEYVVGGGGEDTEVATVFLNQSNPEGKTSWRIRYVAQTGGASANTMTAYAICVPN